MDGNVNTRQSKTAATRPVTMPRTAIYQPGTAIEWTPTRRPRSVTHVPGLSVTYVPGRSMFPRYDRSGRRVLGHVCQGCGAEVNARGVAVTTMAKLPGLDAGRQKRSAPVYQTEGELQAAIVRRLRAGGHTVLSTSRHRRGVTCGRCGAWTMPQGGDGVDRGVPDLLVHADGARWIGLEVKGHRTAVSPEQAALRDAGRIVIVRSVEEAVEACGLEGGRQKEEPTPAHTGARTNTDGHRPASAVSSIRGSRCA